jgi:Ternary complex associated domain 9/WD domain, G-beta repeat/Anaphase-promoting complex subunit 4 WD40 domain
MALLFQRDYLVDLPLPLAQLYSRGYRATDPRSQHEAALSLVEALIKLTVAPAVICYLRDVGRCGSRAVDQGLATLARPSLGQWVGLLRELARHFGQRPDAAAHPLGHLWGQLNTRRDGPGMLTLYRRITNRVDGPEGGDQRCSIFQLFDALVSSRNDLAHGPPRPESFYLGKMNPLLWPALNELLDDGVLNFLGPTGSRLVHLHEIRPRNRNRTDLVVRPLVGVVPGQPENLALDRTQAEDLFLNQVAVLWRGHPIPLTPLEPLVLYRRLDESEEILLFNCRRGRAGVEYLSCTDGRITRDELASPALDGLNEMAPIGMTESSLQAGPGGESPGGPPAGEHLANAGEVPQTTSATVPPPGNLQSPPVGILDEAARHRLKRVPPEFQAFFLAVEEAWGGEFHVYRNFLEGRSGAAVLHVHFTPTDAAPRISASSYILKLDHREPEDGAGAMEQKRHEEARRRNGRFAREHIPECYACHARRSQVALLYQFIGKGSLAALTSSELVGLTRLRNHCRELAVALLDKLNPEPVASHNVKVRDILGQWLGYRLDPARARALHTFIHSAAAESDGFFLDPAGNQLINPLWFSQAREMRGEEMLAFSGFLHRDLHPGNVLLDGSPRSKKYWLIDFVSADPDSYLGYDHAYFELALILDHFEDTPNIASLARLYTILDFLRTDPHREPGEDIRREGDASLYGCLDELRRAEHGWWKKKEPGSLEWIEKQLLLARIAVSINWMNKFTWPRPEQAAEDRAVDNWKARLALTYGGFAACTYLERYQETTLKKLKDAHQARPALRPGPSSAGGQGAERVAAVRVATSEEAPRGCSTRCVLRGHAAIVRQAAWSPDGRVLATLGDDGRVMLWDWQEEPVRPRPLDPPRGPGVTAICWSPKGNILACGHGDGSVRYHPAEQAAVGHFPAHAGAIKALAWSGAAEALLASGARDKTIRLWDRDGSLRGTLEGHAACVLCLAWSPKERILASGGLDAGCRLWRAELGKWSPQSIGDSFGLVAGVAWSPDGRQLACGTSDHVIRIWSPAGDKIRKVSGHEGKLTGLAFSHDGRLLASKARDGTVRLWRCDTWELATAPLREPASNGWPLQIAFHPSQPILATLEERDTAIRIWELDPAELLR